MSKLSTPKEIVVEDPNGYTTYKGITVFCEDGIFPYALIYIPNTEESLGMLAICELHEFDNGDAVWRLVAPAAAIDLCYKQEKLIKNLLINITEEAQNE